MQAFLCFWIYKMLADVILPNTKVADVAIKKIGHAQTQRGNPCIVKCVLDAKVLTQMQKCTQGSN